MAQIPGLARIRLSSLEPADVTERLLDTFCKHRNIMPHLHLALQSGSDAVLKRMCRQYRVEQFKKTVDAIQTRLDRPALTTDIIVGFPGETDADFEHTLDLARSVGFAKMHVFTFSPRRGTPAASMQDIVEKGVCRSRSEILRELDIELGLRRHGGSTHHAPRSTSRGPKRKILQSLDRIPACRPSGRVLRSAFSVQRSAVHSTRHAERDCDGKTD
jgi:tRNA A37 methylthiotransferase MiaB